MVAADEPVKRLVVAPHPDDEVMGAGGLMAKHEGTYAVCMTFPSHGRMAEWETAGDILGSISLGHLGMPDGKIDENPKRAVGALDEVLHFLQPDEVYLPYPGSHQDHVATYEACVRACRQSLDPEHWMPGTVLVYETPAYDIDLHAWPLRYSVFESLDEQHVLTKVKAMQAYESQIVKPHPGSPEYLADRARMLGVARDVDFAEQFAPIRLVRR